MIPKITSELPRILEAADQPGPGAVPRLLTRRAGLGDDAAGRHRSTGRRRGTMTAQRLIALSALGLAWAAAPDGRAETYPSRPIHIIVPYAAGGVNDVAARLLQP